MGLAAPKLRAAIFLKDIIRGGDMILVPPPIMDSTFQIGTLGGGTGPGGVKLPSDPECNAVVGEQLKYNGSPLMNVTGGLPGKDFTWECPDNYFFILQYVRIFLNCQTPINVLGFGNTTALPFGLRLYAGHCPVFGPIKSNFDICLLLGLDPDGRFGQNATLLGEVDIHKATGGHGHFIYSVDGRPQTIKVTVQDNLQITGLTLGMSIFGYTIPVSRNP